MSVSPDRFLRLLRQELHLSSSDRVLLVSTNTTNDVYHTDSPERVLKRSLPSGDTLVIEWEQAPPHRVSCERKVDMLLETFAESLAVHTEFTMDAKQLSLNELLDHVKQETHAICVLIVDDNSPEIWAQTGDEELDPDPHGIHKVKPLHEHIAMIAPHVPSVTQKALWRVREHPTTAQLHKGASLHMLEPLDENALFAKSFAGIYVIVLLVPQPLDELGVERVLHKYLPWIESRILSLPPRDPDGTGRKVNAKRV